jgi:hypothetical protein
MEDEDMYLAPIISMEGVLHMMEDYTKKGAFATFLVFLE